jgi:hypothetical protein
MKQQLLSMLFTKKPSLLFCIAMDAAGMLTFFFPAIGEWGDMAWAPISAYIFRNAFGGLGGLVGGAFSFIEELLPFSDIIPTFTIAWYIQNKYKNSTSNQVNNQKDNNDIEDAEIIEIK